MGGRAFPGLGRPFGSRFCLAVRRTQRRSAWRSGFAVRRLAVGSGKRTGGVAREPVREADAGAGAKALAGTGAVVCGSGGVSEAEAQVDVRGLVRTGKAARGFRAALVLRRVTRGRCGGAPAEGVAENPGRLLSWRLQRGGDFPHQLKVLKRP